MAEKRNIKLLVFGGRDFTAWNFLRDYLDAVAKEFEVTHVIHGDYRGADKLADKWALLRGIQPVRCPALWDAHDRRAGPIRNGRMVELRPDLAVGFVGGDGTADCERQARAAGIEVRLARQK
jgi:hypothetical protein